MVGPTELVEKWLWPVEAERSGRVVAEALDAPGDFPGEEWDGRGGKM